MVIFNSSHDTVAYLLSTNTLLDVSKLFKNSLVFGQTALNHSQACIIASKKKFFYRSIQNIVSYKKPSFSFSCQSNIYLTPVITLSDIHFL